MSDGVIAPPGWDCSPLSLRALVSTQVGEGYNVQYVPYVPDLEKRLQDRYEELVKGHTATLQDVAAGIRSLPDVGDSFAATQAAWRFFKNEDTTLPVLMQPLLQLADAAVRSSCSEVALVACDWSQLHYSRHSSKADRTTLMNRDDLGYELHTALLVSDVDGSPIAPVHQSLRSAEGLFQSSTDRVRRKLDDAKLDRLLPVFRFVHRRDWPKPPVFIIDREADSVDHYRRWDRAKMWFVVRADDNRVVLHNGRERLLPQVHQDLRDRGAFRFSREVKYHDREARQYVAEAEVCLHRSGKSKHGRISKRGKVLRLRLVVTEVRNAEGEVLAYWLLMTNVPPLFDASTVALWYYWRWTIESYFKLAKSAGLELEHWGQTTALAIAKRLLVGSMACALAWKISRSVHPTAPSLRAVLIRLSSRQMKHGVEHTEPALLAGLWALMQGLALAEEFDLDHLRQMLQEVLCGPEGPPHPGPSPPNSLPKLLV